ncbi:MAG TPA: ABC transporter permease [Thermomicrobiaceae bacterium]|nr:ABC transporter permease [Thermomicrobiaceae bacterium]
MAVQASQHGGRDVERDVLVGGVERKRVSRGRQFWRSFSRSKGAVLSGAILILLVLMAIAAPWIEPHDPLGVSPGEFLSGPTLSHPFGTDQYGRDVLSRVISGSRISLTVGGLAVIFSVLIGTALGLVAGYSENVVDSVIMRLIDMLLAFPGILLALAIVAGLGTSTVNVIIAIGVGGIPVYARVARGSVLSAKREAYVDAGRVIGCSAPRLMVRHILPNIFAPVLVLATIGIAFSILIGAALSYLGLGIQPPRAEWGLMISDGQNYLNDAWWISTFPGIALAITVLCVNLVGDGLRDAFDPRTRRR